MIQLAELRARCNALAEQFNSLWGRLDLPSKEARLEEIEKIISSPDAWNDQQKSVFLRFFGHSRIPVTP